MKLYTKKHHFQVNNFDDNNNNLFPSMGIYVINKDVMRKLLIETFPNVDDLKSQVIPGAISLGMKVIITFSYFSLKKITFFGVFVLP